MEAALYGEGGFFASGQGARQDFVTSPEVGSLFGVCVARALDRYWHALDEPDPFLVVEAGAGSGSLARDVLHANPECARALRYVLVERSPVLRDAQRALLPLDPPDEALGPFVRRHSDDAPVPEQQSGPVVASIAELPALEAREAVVFANELLDNLPFGIAQWDGSRWSEVRIALEGDAPVEVLVPLPEPLPYEVAPGARVPIARGVRDWFLECERALHSGFVVLVDYMTDAPELRLRTYRGHERAADPLQAPGSFDITADVPVDQLLSAAHAFSLVSDTAQAEWLRSLGIDELADAGAQAWRDGAARGDLEALKGRSHVHEAEILTDPSGFGAHRVLVLERKSPG
jgi:SAM-dependent MidA family methyltransferase